MGVSKTYCTHTHTDIAYITLYTQGGRNVYTFKRKKETVPKKKLHNEF